MNHGMLYFCFKTKSEIWAPSGHLVYTYVFIGLQVKAGQDWGHVVAPVHSGEYIGVVVFGIVVFGIVIVTIVGRRGAHADSALFATLCGTRLRPVPMLDAA